MLISHGSRFCWRLPVAGVRFRRLATGNRQLILETQLIIAERVGYLLSKELFGTLDESRRVLEGYISYVRRR